MYTLESLQHTHERRRNFQNNLCTLGLQKPGVPDKLDGVAITLLAVQQNGFAKNRFCAEPQRLLEVSFTRFARFGLPSPFIQRQSSRKIALH